MMEEHSDRVAPAWRPTRVEVDGFRGFGQTASYTMTDPITMLVGANGSGKSSALNAIEWCLFGEAVSIKGSGIDERMDWVVCHRASPRASVSLHFACDGDSFVVTRSKRAAASGPSSLVVQLQDQRTLEGSAAMEWLTGQGLPDWETWRKSFCQHQEDCRSRILDTRGRSDQIAAMLGLQDLRQMREALDRERRSAQKAIARSNQCTASIEERYRNARKNTDVQQDILGKQLGDRGHAQEDLHDAHFVEQLHVAFDVLPGEMSQMAREHNPTLLVRNAEIEASYRQANELLELATQQRRAREKELEQRKKECQDLEGELRAYGPIAMALREASASVDSMLRKHGSEADLSQSIADLSTRIRDLEARRADMDVQVQILESSEKHLQQADDANQCPVCDTRTQGLLDQIRTRLEQLRSEAQAALAKELDELQQSKGQQERHKENLVQAQVTRKGRADAAAAANQRIVALIQAQETDVDEVQQEALRHVEHLRREIQRLDPVVQALERSTEDLRAKIDDAGLYLRWKKQESEREPVTSSVQDLPAWGELEEALDRIGGMTADLESLAQMAKELEQESSHQRLAEVNDRLGTHFAKIIGDRSSRRVQVKAKGTAKKLSYILQDQHGEDLTPILNQASLNALSYAFLLGQAEHRSDQGQCGWLLLDDPTQSLDEEHQQGLADALLAVASTTPVLVAALPGQFASMLREQSRVPTTAWRVERIADQSRLEVLS